MINNENLGGTHLHSHLTIGQTLLWIGDFWKQLKGRVVILLLLTPVAVFFSAYVPVFLADIFNELVGTHISEKLIREKALLVLAFGFIHLIFFILIQSLRGETNARMENDFRLRLFRHVVQLSGRFLRIFSTGDLVTRMVDDVGEQKLSWFACSGIFRLYEGSVRILLYLFFMAQLDGLLTLAALLPLTLIVFIYIQASTRMITYSQRTQEAISRLNSFLTSTINGIRIVKSYNQESRQAQGFEMVVNHQLQKEIQLVRVSSLLELSYSRFAELIVILVFIFGGWLYMQGQISIGILVAFNSYILMLVWPMVDIGQFYVKGRGAGVSIQRIQELEAFPVAISATENPLPFPDQPLLHFEHVSYAFEEGQAVLDDIHFEVHPGETVALAGAVGSGKSLFVQLLPRMVVPTQGQIYLNHIPLPDYNLCDLREHIGFVSQEPDLFSDTIRNNIIFGRPDITEEAIQLALDVSQLSRDMAAFSEGLETVIGQRGVKISGGQKQRIAIARAIARKPSILVLDDCTSALDADTEAALWKAIYQFIPGITVFLITHRVSALQRADRIVVFDRGRVSDMGTHDELSQRCDIYRNLYLF